MVLTPLAWRGVVLLGEGDLIEIAGGMQNPEHLDAGVRRTEVEAVFTEGIAAAAFGEFRAWPPDGLPLGEVFELVAEPQEQSIRLENTVLGDVVPDFLEVGLCLW